MHVLLGLLYTVLAFSVFLFAGATLHNAWIYIQASARETAKRGSKNIPWRAPVWPSEIYLTDEERKLVSKMARIAFPAALLIGFTAFWILVAKRSL